MIGHCDQAELLGLAPATKSFHKKSLSNAKSVSDTRYQ